MSGSREDEVRMKRGREDEKKKRRREDEKMKRRGRKGSKRRVGQGRRAEKEFRKMAQYRREEEEV